MRNRRQLTDQRKKLVTAADALISFNDMIEIGRQGAPALAAESEILRYYNIFEKLVGLVQEGRVEVVAKRKHVSGLFRLEPGRDFALVTRCILFNDCVLDRYVLSPDLSEWQRLLGEGRFSGLKAASLNAVFCSVETLELIDILMTEYCSVITGRSHLKRRANMAVTSSRRIASIQRVVDSACKLCERVDAHLLDLVWANDCRARKTLDDTAAALAFLTNGIRHRAIYSGVLAAVLCVEVSESKGIHIKVLLLLRDHASQIAVEFGRYWSDQCTAGQGDFMHFSDARIASIFSKWSGLPVEELYGLPDLRFDHSGSLFLEAAIESFSRNSLMLRARSTKKHRQIRILTGNIVRGLNGLSCCPDLVNVEARS